VLNALAVAATAVGKFCNDIRLLAARGEIEEPMRRHQVGSSAMPHKRNPMLCERATGLARFVTTLAQGGLGTAAAQWLERTLDDSSIRRLVLPESFLALDGALEAVLAVTAGLVVHERVIRDGLARELPFLATENLLMAAVRNGVDRQEAHEAIRRHCRAAAEQIKSTGGANDLLERLRAEPLLAGVELGGALDPSDYVGRAPEQVDRFLEEVVEPIRQRYGWGRS
jgi:adenylosuccinate lyase